MFIVLLFKSGAGFNAHWQIMLRLSIRRAGFRPSRTPNWVAPALLGFSVTLNNVNMVIQKSIIFFVFYFQNRLLLWTAAKLTLELPINTNATCCQINSGALDQPQPFPLT